VAYTTASVLEHCRETARVSRKVVLPECDRCEDEDTCGRAAAGRRAGARLRGRKLTYERCHARQQSNTSVVRHTAYGAHYVLRGSEPSAEGHRWKKRHGESSYVGYHQLPWTGMRMNVGHTLGQPRMRVVKRNVTCGVYVMTCKGGTMMGRKESDTESNQTQDQTVLCPWPGCGSFRNASYLRHPLVCTGNCDASSFADVHQC